MGFLDKLFNNKKEVEEKGFKPIESQFSKLFFTNTSPITNHDEEDLTYIHRGYRQNPTVYSIISMVSKNAGLAKWKVYKRGPGGTKTPYNDVLLDELMYKPNALMTWNALIQEAIGYKMLTGNAYFWGIPGSNDLTKDKFSSLYVLPSQYVDIKIAENKRFIEGYSMDFFGRSRDEVIPEDQVLHVKDFNPSYIEGSGDFLYGQSPLQAALTSLFTNNDSIETSRSYLLNQGPRGILSIMEDETYGGQSESQINSLRTRFKNNHTGVKKAGELLVAPGDWKWHEIGSSAADLKLIEHYNLTVNDLCNIYNFPTILLGNGETTFANLKEAKKALWSNVIIPMLTQFRDALNCWLAPKYGEDICIDFDITDIKELQDDLKTQADAVSKLQNIITVNEARAFINLAPLAGPEGDEIFRFIQGTEMDRDDAE